MAAPGHKSIENLPIDIHYNKLLDWLINRRHCQQEWQASTVTIREKINAALVDMPPVDEITSLLEGTYVNYFHCLKIVELLKDTESGKKNIFGQYSSQGMKAWMEILKLYEKDSIYLAETAQMLARNVNYEVPALKKQISKCQQMQKECERKETDYIAKATELKKKYDATCKQMGIKGKKIKSELAALVTDLPTEFNRIADSAVKLKKAITFYNDFSSFVMNNAEITTGSLPMLSYVLKNGNSTTYQWRKGKKPEVVEEAKIFIDTSDEQDVTGDLDIIDWGDPGANTESGVDFGDEIDFNMADITVETGGTEVEGNSQDGIDLGPADQDSSDSNGIDLGPADQDSSDSNGIDWTEVVIVDKPDSDEGVAKGTDALSILDNPKTRVLFLDDIMELEAFLTQRLHELESSSRGSDVLSSSQFQSAPLSIQVAKDEVVAMVTVVKDILSELTSVKMQHLMMIRNSPRLCLLEYMHVNPFNPKYQNGMLFSIVLDQSISVCGVEKVRQKYEHRRLLISQYVDRLRDNLKQTLTLADKMTFMEKEMVERHKEAVAEQRETEPKLDVVIRKTKEMQKQMEGEISKKYKDRPVNIMGEINTM